MSNRSLCKFASLHVLSDQPAGGRLRSCEKGVSDGKVSRLNECVGCELWAKREAAGFVEVEPPQLPKPCNCGGKKCADCPKVGEPHDLAQTLGRGSRK
jgi:hypothetical protein